MRADNTDHLRVASRRRSALARERAEVALAELQSQHEPISVAGLARAAKVARSWIYTQPDLIEQIEQSRNLPPRPPKQATATAATDASWQRRLELAHNRIAELTAENKQLRHQLALAHGHLRSERISASTTPSMTQTHSSDATTTE